MAPWLCYATSSYQLSCGVFCVPVWRARSRQLCVDEREQVDWVCVLSFSVYMRWWCDTGEREGRAESGKVD